MWFESKRWVNTTTTGELLSLLLLHAVKQVGIKISWWHRENNRIFCSVFTFVLRFLPQCAHLFHDLMCASARMLNGKSDKNKCDIHCFLFKFGKCCFSRWSYRIHHSTWHLINSSSPDGLLNFCDAQCQDRLPLFIINQIIFFVIWCT